MCDDDHVIREIPVFLSKCLQEQLYLIQYPQRPATISMEAFDILRTRIKPLQNKIQVELELDQEAESYDEETAEFLAEAAEGIGLDEDKYMPDRKLRIDKMTMESTSVPKLTGSSRYVVGVVRGAQVSLTPIKSIVQMKTIFPYLNKAEKARTAYQKERLGGDTEDEVEETEATKVTVKFSRNSASAATVKGPVRVNSYTSRKKEEEEPWVDLSYIHDDPLEYEKMYSTNLDNETPFYVLSRANFLPQLFPKHVETSIEGTNKKKDTHPKISIQQMRLMTVPDQLRVLMLNAKVLQYNQVLDYLKTKLRCEFDEASLLRSIQTVATLVQGCWVVRSDVIYPEDFKSGANGIIGSIMQRARDRILSEFTEHRFVERRIMIGMTRLPSEEVTEILSHVSKMTPNKGWEFLLPYDADFVSRNPDVVQRQTLIWEMKNQQRTRKKSTSDSKDSPPLRPPSTRRRSRNMSFSSDNDSGAEGDISRRRSSGSRQRRNSTRSDIGIPSRVET